MAHGSRRLDVVLGGEMVASNWSSKLNRLHLLTQESHTCTYTHRQRQSDRVTDRQTDRQTDRD